MIASAAILCLALNIYYEARGEPIDGQYAVAHVTLNRVHDPAYPNEVCQVVYQKSQFSWTLEAPKPPTGKSWELSVSIASDVVKKRAKRKDNTFGATHYHADYVSPKWSYRLAKVRKIGRHIFYKKHS